MEGMEGGYTHPLFSCCHRTHMRTLHVFFLSGVSRGLQLICVIAPPPPHPIHTHIHPNTTYPSIPPFQPPLSLAPQLSCFNLATTSHRHMHTQTPTAFFQDFDGEPMCNKSTRLNTVTQFYCSLMTSVFLILSKGFKALHTPNNVRRTDFFTSFQVKKTN